MASVDSSVMDFWQEYNERWPLNTQRDDWMRHAVMMMQLKALGAYQLAAAGTQVDPYEFNDFLPKQYHIKTVSQTAARQEEVLKKGLRI